MNQHFRKGGHIHDANRFTHGLHLGCDDVIDCGSIEGVVVFLRHALAGEPAGPFESVYLLMHRALGFQQVVKRGWLDRPTRKAVEMRKGNFVAQAVVLFGLHHLPIFRGIASETARIILAHRDIGRPAHHPSRQFARQAGPPADSDLRSAATPVVAHPRGRADQRIAVRRVAYGSVNLALNAKVNKDRHPVQTFLKVGHYAIVIGVEQPVLIVPRAMVAPNRVRVFFLVDADQPAILLHSDVAGDLPVVADDGQLGIQRLEFGHRLGHKVMVRHRGRRQLKP